MMKIFKRERRGITLIALVITIIVLLILAGITVAQLSGNNLFENAKLAKEKYQKSKELEDEVIGDYEDAITGDRGNKGKYELIVSKTKTELSSLSDNKYVVNNIDLNKYSEIVVYSIYNDGVLASNRVPIELFKIKTELSAIHYWGSYINTKAFYINDTSVSVQILSTSSATEVQLYGIY